MSIYHSQLCSILPGKEFRRKLTEIIEANIIKVSASPEEIKKKKILHVVNDSFTQIFGIFVDNKIIQIKGNY